MERLTSRDGTVIAVDRTGEGPSVILVSGGPTDRMANADLAAELAPYMTVLNYDRRGRGDSTDTPPYSVERELEDLEAVVSLADGSAAVYGTSSGAALALEGAAAGLPITRLALWEPPYHVNGRTDLPADTPSMYRSLVATGQRGEAVEFFMSRVVGLPPDFVAGAKRAPWWAYQESLAHTLEYDATVMGDFRIPADRVQEVATPTLVANGSASFDYTAEAAEALAAMLPNAKRLILTDQQHNVDPKILAPALVEFFLEAVNEQGRDAA